MTTYPKATTEPTAMVIFGATGDLAQRKLYPALFDLFSKNVLPNKFAVIAFGRREFSTELYREFVKIAILQKKSTPDATLLGAFLSRIQYVRGTFDDDVSYKRLSDSLATADKLFNVCSNKLFYLAVPPNLYEQILTKLSRSGLTIPCIGNEGWTRILLEKPFGKDAETAAELDRLLGKLFSEQQIFRIDHYLAKETIQNILAFRFSNALFEPLWNRKHIDRIEIHMSEKETVGSRGAFYDGIGALRDVGQNHLLAMLALVTMEYPKGFTAAGIQKERARLLKRLIPITGAGVKKIARAQYDGYVEEAGVDGNSQTETFFSLTCFLRGNRWSGVPVVLTAGKGLYESKSEILVHFRDIDSGIGDVESRRNILTFRIQPDEGISILFWVKKPGFENRAVHTKTLSFNYADSFDTQVLPDAYERVLYDCVRGDQTLFASTDEMGAAWKFITPILRAWSKTTLRKYTRGATPEDIQENT